MKRIVLILLMPVILFACQAAAPTRTPPPVGTGTAIPPPIILPTFTPAPLTDPELLEVKRLLKEGFERRDSKLLQSTISFSKWVGSIYREGGTPPIDPPRGLTLSMEFANSNDLVVDLERPTYEPLWSKPAGDTSVLVHVTPKEGEPYYAHLYIQHEPSAWRYTGILSRLPYYDAPTIAQVRANSTKYKGKEFMYVGEYATKADPPADAGTPPPNAAFALNTFAGPIWVVMADQAFTVGPPQDADARAGQLMRVFGTVKLNDGVPYLEADSVQFIAPNAWAHVKGRVESVDAMTREITITPEGSGSSKLKIAATSFISLPDGSRGALEDIKPGQTIDATGVPEEDGPLLVEELFVNQ